MRACVLLCALVAASAHAPAAVGSIVCFGDSWAAFACDALKTQAELHLRSNKVINRGVAGTTASLWANDTGLMLAQIVAEGIPEFVWLSIGGNDLLDGWAGGACVGNASTASATACFDVIHANIVVMLDALFAALPLVQVVIFGYDCACGTPAGALA